MLILILKQYNPPNAAVQHPVTTTQFVGAFDSKEDAVQFINETLSGPVTDFHPASNENRRLLSMYGKACKSAEETSSFQGYNGVIYTDTQETYLLAEY